MDRTEALFRKLHLAVKEWTQSRGRPWADYDWKLKCGFDDVDEEWRNIHGEMSDARKILSLEERVAKLERELTMTRITRAEGTKVSGPDPIREAEAFEYIDILCQGADEGVDGE